MFAAVLHGRHDLRVESRPIPEPGPGEVLLRVGAVGLCGTDVAEWASGPRLVPLYKPNATTGHVGPTVLGHEFSGVVAAVAPDVPSDLLG